MHLAELPMPDVLNSMMPGLGRDWTEIQVKIGLNSLYSSDNDSGRQPVLFVIEGF